jgi:hypothetical protein
MAAQLVTSRVVFSSVVSQPVYNRTLSWRRNELLGGKDFLCDLVMSLYSSVNLLGNSVLHTTLFSLFHEMSTI